MHFTILPHIFFLCLLWSHFLFSEAAAVLDLSFLETGSFKKQRVVAQSKQIPVKCFAAVQTAEGLVGRLDPSHMRQWMSGGLPEQISQAQRMEWSSGKGVEW